jgi:hypothetical protein
VLSSDFSRRFGILLCGNVLQLEILCSRDSRAPRDSYSTLSAVSDHGPTKIFGRPRTVLLYAVCLVVCSHIFQ